MIFLSGSGFNSDYTGFIAFLFLAVVYFSIYKILVNSDFYKLSKEKNVIMLVLLFLIFFTFMPLFYILIFSID